MDEARKAGIASALQFYRRTVEDINLSALRFVIDGVEEDPAPDDCSEDEVRDLRVELLRSQYGIWLDSPEHTVASIHDFLSDDNKATLVATCSLDGINHGHVDITGRQAWFDELWNRINGIDGVQQRPEGLPEDLKYLSTQVRGICGPGLPKYREIDQFSFLTDLSLLSEYQDDRVTVPLSQQQMDNNEFNALSPAWDGWNISLGVRLGDGPRAWGGGYILYCQKPSSERNEWRWRYGMKDEDYESDLFDTVEEFLEFYAQFKAQSEDSDNIEIVPLEEIM